MSQTFTIPSELPVATNVPVWSIADVTTGDECGLSVRTRFVVSSSGDDSSIEYIRNCSEREHIMRCDAEGVTIEDELESFVAERSIGLT